MLSSLSLFKGIVTSHKGDVWAIVRDFIVATLKKTATSEFTICELRSAMIKEFNIDIENAVLKNVLEHLDFVVYNFEKKKYESTATIATIDTESFYKELNDNQQQCKELEEELYNFYCQENNINCIDEKSKILLKDYFFRYLIDKELSSSDEITILVSRFALLFETTSRKRELISNIRQGLIMLEGLNYSKSTDNKTWKYETTFFLDAHYLFSLFNLNSTYHRDNVNDFLELVKQINEGSIKKHNGRKRIILTYFPETKALIDKFFNTAIRIKNGDETLKPCNEAMCKIIETCDEAEDVSALKVQFYNFLRKCDIEEFTEKIELTAGKDYLYETTELKELVEKTFAPEEKEEVYDLFKFADYINILRKGTVVKDLEACSYIFLTDKTLGKKVCHFLKKNDQQARTNVFEKMEWFTQRMWFLTCQSFTFDRSLTSFDLAIKAKMVLSGICQSNVADIYERLKNRNDTPEETIAMYEDMRNYKYSADSIDETSSKTLIQKFSAGALDQFHESYQRMLQKANRTEILEEEFAELSKQMAEKESDIERLKNDVTQLANSKKIHSLFEIVAIVIIVILSILLILI